MRTERVGLLEAVGRVLGAPILADRDQPPFDRATRDGFAVRAEEISAGSGAAGDRAGAGGRAVDGRVGGGGVG